MLKSLYGTFAEYNLEAFIQKDSFASHICKCLGSELSATLEILDDEDNSSGFPVLDLYDLLVSGWSLDHEWFKWTDEIYRDDNKIEIPSSIPRSYSAAEQMAAYGLHVLRAEINACGPVPDDGENEQGWGREGVQEHEATCLIWAYQAIVYAQQLQQGCEPTAEEKARFINFDFSALGKAGAIKRHAPMATLREWAVKKYQASEWASANQAAHDLKICVIEHGRTIGAHLSEENAQRTIAEWLRKSA